MDLENLVVLGRRTDEKVKLPERVWYAAYGSNLLLSRMQCYLHGKAPTSAHTPHPGCRNSQDPTEDRLVIADHGLLFGGHSEPWGGGVAFLDPEPESGMTLLRLWNVTREQFEDIAAQENGIPPGSVNIDFASFVQKGGEEIIGGGWYSQGLYLGDFEEKPVVTFTCKEVRPWKSPGPIYANVIKSGLIESGLSAAQADVYAERWSL